MLWIVISFNLALALLCLWVAWKLHQLRQRLRCFSQRCAIAAQAINATLPNAPAVILGGQQGVQRGRNQVAQWIIWQRQIQALWSLIGLIQSIYRQSGVPPLPSLASRRPQRK